MSIVSIRSLKSFTVLMGILLSLLVLASGGMFISLIISQYKDKTPEPAKEVVVRYVSIDSIPNGAKFFLTKDTVVLNEIHSKLAAVELRQADLINDVRQETNSNLDKMSAWLSFWIGILALLGVFVPIVYQIFVFRLRKEELNELKDKINREIAESREQLCAHQIKMQILSFANAKENGHASDENSNVAKMYLKHIREEFDEFIKTIENEKDDHCDISKLRPHIYSVLVNIEKFLIDFDIQEDHRRHRCIKQAKDEIKVRLDDLESCVNRSKILEALRKISIKLSEVC